MNTEKIKSDYSSEINEVIGMSGYGSIAKLLFLIFEESFPSIFSVTQRSQKVSYILYMIQKNNFTKWSYVTCHVTPGHLGLNL